jgi:uncharacterized membrane protein YecN with MAPEG domain
MIGSSGAPKLLNQSYFYPCIFKGLTVFTKKSMKLVPVYTALLVCLFVFLSIRVIALRRRLKISLGDEGNPALLRAMRAQANFAEYVPLSLLLLVLAEFQSAPSYLIHFLASLLLVARLLHAYGLSQTPENHVFRVIGMAGTFTTLLVGAAWLLARTWAV